MINRLSIQPQPLLFAARKKAAAPAPDVQPQTKPAEPQTEKPTIGLPLHYLITSGGDGSYAPHFFTSAKERDAAQEWLEENDSEPVGESTGSLKETDVYRSAADFIKEREY